MSDSPENENGETNEAFVESVDFYFEDGLMVLTRHYLLKRGFCCKSGCRHCPYGYARESSK